jgi:nitrate/nitrite-specific signal transduction histidine kinase
MNQENMVVADLEARKKALSARQQMYTMLLIAAIVSGGLLFFTGRWILRPITRLIHSANEIKKGNLDLVIQSSSRDEVGQLSKAFNEMASPSGKERSDQIFRIQRATGL